jgi:hypothetical protein
MAFSLRLSPYLEAEARQRAELLGISLNSLISVALDLHLSSSRVTDNTPQSVLSIPAQAPVNTVAKAVSEPQKPPVLQALERPLSPTNPPFILGSGGNNDPKPVLPPNPSKRDRQLLAQWYARNNKR